MDLVLYSTLCAHGFRLPHPLLKVAMLLFLFPSPTKPIRIDTFLILLRRAHQREHMRLLVQYIMSQGHNTIEGLNKMNRVTLDFT